MKRRVILVIASVVLVLGLLLAGFGCAGEAPSTEAKTLKIGMNEALNWPIGVDTMNAIQLDVDQVNAGGGLLIGGERYNFELIVDDNKQDVGLAKTVAEKQIFDNGVDFIIGDFFCMSYLDLADENKVVTIATPFSDEILDPKYNYCFSGSHALITWSLMSDWVAKQFPDKKTVAFVLVDTIQGHTALPVVRRAAEVSGLTVLEEVFYPPGQVEYSAVGTKIKTLNPSLVFPGGSPDLDSLIIKACYVAGYQGQIVETSPIPGGYFLSIAGPAASEGLIALAWPAEFEPAATEMAAEFKADWIAKYGQWTDPEMIATPPWWILKAALQKASSPDPDEVADIIGGGLEFECPLGAAIMISRLDYDNPRTVQIILEDFIKQVVEGEIQYLDRISVQEACDYLKTEYGW